jgi:hypothetical protein
MMTRVRRHDWEDDDYEMESLRAARCAEALAQCGASQAADAGASASDDGASGAYEGYEASSGDSWLSNAAIIGSLPTDKLRRALARYKSLVRICEEELRVRALQPSRSNGKHRARIGATSEAVVSRAHRARPKQSALSPEQLTQALMMLIQLRKVKQNNAQNEKERQTVIG